VIAFAPRASATVATDQLVVPVAVPEEPVAAFVQVTEVTPMSSEAVPPSARLDEDVAYVGDEVGVVMVQVGAAESYVTVIASVPTFPSPSKARSVMTLAPTWSAMLLTVQLVVPVAVPEPPRLFVQVTEVTATLSAAVPARLIVELVVA
jgi:hypothetical protein